MQTGILFAFLAYLAYSCSDAAVKALGGSLSVYEIGFFLSALALLPALLSKRREDSWRSVMRPKRPWLVLARTVSGTLGGICATIAFTTLPLAEAYALIFVVPLFAAVLSWLVLKEEVSLARWASLLGGLAGVMLVVRPGFREVLPGHLAALGAAFCGAVTVILLRKLGPTEKRVTLVGAVLGGATLVNGVLMIPSFTVPSASVLPVMLLGGVAAGIGHVLIVSAARVTPASRIAPTQYSQIVWAAVLGALFFGEVPDPVAVIGMCVVGFCGLATFMPERRRAAGAAPSRAGLAAGTLVSHLRKP